MGAERNQRPHGGLETVHEFMERLGIAHDADWMAVVLFVRNLVAGMTLFSEEEKARIQNHVFDQLSQRPLDQESLRRVVNSIESFLLDNARTRELNERIAAERQSYNALYDEMSRVFADIHQSTAARETDIKRMGADTEHVINTTNDRTEVVRRMRGMITELVSQAREEARSWQERATQLERTANFDPLLSELYSRRALDAELALALERTRRINAPLSLMFIDVDHFKHVNDTYGHIAGDGVLRVLAAIISAHASQFNGYSARFGGEELVILCEGMDEGATLVRADDLRQDVERCPMVTRDGEGKPLTPLHITVSIGVAQIRPDQTASDLLLAADRAMYTAKTRGRNRVVGFGSSAPEDRR